MAEILQNECSVSTEGHRWMFYHDKWPKHIRLKISKCPYNLCTMCLRDHAFTLLHKEANFPEPDFIFEGEAALSSVEKAIDLMEKAIRENQPIDELVCWELNNA